MSPARCSGLASWRPAAEAEAAACITKGCSIGAIQGNPRRRAGGGGGGCGALTRAAGLGARLRDREGLRGVGAAASG